MIYRVYLKIGNWNCSVLTESEFPITQVLDNFDLHFYELIYPNLEVTLTKICYD